MNQHSVRLAKSQRVQLPPFVERAPDLRRAGAGEDYVRIVRRLRDLQDLEVVERRGEVGPAPPVPLRARVGLPAIDPLVGARQHLARPAGVDREAPAARFVVDPAGRGVGPVPGLADIVAEPDRMADRGGVGGDVHLRPPCGSLDTPRAPHPDLARGETRMTDVEAAAKAPFAGTALAPPSVEAQQTGDGSWLLRQPAKLGEVPDHLIGVLRERAAEAPDRTFLAERGADGGWRRLDYAAAVARSAAIGQALIERGHGPDRPVAILSDNSIDFGLLQLGCMPRLGAGDAGLAGVFADVARLRETEGRDRPPRPLGDLRGRAGPLRRRAGSPRLARPHPAHRRRRGRHREPRRLGGDRARPGAGGEAGRGRPRYDRQDPAHLPARPGCPRG